MDDSRGGKVTTRQGVSQPRADRRHRRDRPLSTFLEAHAFKLFGIATVLAALHTMDEIRIGEFIAVPFGLINLVLVLLWSRMGRRGRAATSIGFGLFWGLAVLPYHVLPLLAGAATWQNLSGLTRLVAGCLMVATGLALLRRPTRG